MKELDFFSYRYDHGYQWYERSLGESTGARARGEISPSYFCEPEVAARVARYMPDVRILLSLRDPVERALSNHRHEVREGHLSYRDLSFEFGLENNPMYVERGLYATHLRRWLQHFPRDRILVVLMEDVESDPAEVSRTVYHFLGVEDSFVPAGVAGRYNRSYATRWALLGGLKDAAYRATRLPGLSRLWDAAAGAGLRSMYQDINTLPSSAVIPKPREQTLRQLRHRFDPEIRELETLLDRSLAAWLKP